MRLSVRSIQSRPGAKLTAEFRHHIGRLDDEAEVLGPVHLQVTATNLGGRISLEGRLQAEVRLTCSRCAADYVLPLDETVQEFYVRHDQADRTADGSPARPGRDHDVWEHGLDLDPWMEDEDADERVYRDDTIELDSLVRELLLLALPMKPICREDCLGLCPVCGTDLNVETCNCEQDRTDPRLAVLKQWMEAEGGPSSN